MKKEQIGNIGHNNQLLKLKLKEFENDMYRTSIVAKPFTKSIKILAFLFSNVGVNEFCSYHLLNARIPAALLYFWMVLSGCGSSLASFVAKASGYGDEIEGLQLRYNLSTQEVHFAKMLEKEFKVLFKVFPGCNYFFLPHDHPFRPKNDDRAAIRRYNKIMKLMRAKFGNIIEIDDWRTLSSVLYPPLFLDNDVESGIENDNFENSDSQTFFEEYNVLALLELNSKSKNSQEFLQHIIGHNRFHAIYMDQTLSEKIYRLYSHLGPRKLISKSFLNGIYWLMYKGLPSLQVFLTVTQALHVLEEAFFFSMLGDKWYNNLLPKSLFLIFNFSIALAKMSVGYEVKGSLVDYNYKESALRHKFNKHKKWNKTALCKTAFVSIFLFLYAITTAVFYTKNGPIILYRQISHMVPTNWLRYITLPKKVSDVALKSLTALSTVSSALLITEINIKPTYEKFCTNFRSGEDSGNWFWFLFCFSVLIDAGAFGVNCFVSGEETMGLIFPMLVSWILAGFIAVALPFVNAVFNVKTGKPKISHVKTLLFGKSNYNLENFPPSKNNTLDPKVFKI